MEIRMVQDGMPGAPNIRLRVISPASGRRVVNGLVQYIFLPFEINRLVGWSDESGPSYTSLPIQFGFITWRDAGMYLARIRVVDQRGTWRPGLFRATVSVRSVRTALDPAF